MTFWIVGHILEVATANDVGFAFLHQLECSIADLLESFPATVATQLVQISWVMLR